MQVSNTAVAASSDERQLKQIAKRYVADYPDLHELARSAAQSIIFRHTGKHLDPAHVYWHRFSAASSSHLSFTGWKHTGPPVQSMTMIELLIHRFEVSDQSSADELALYGGFYTDGPGHAFFDERNEVRLLPEEVLRDFWALDFSAGYRRKMDRFWARHSENCCLLAKASYLARAGESVARRHLSLADFQTVLSVVSPDPVPALDNCVRQRPHRRVFRCFLWSSVHSKLGTYCASSGLEEGRFSTLVGMRGPFAASTRISTFTSGSRGSFFP